MLSRSCRRTAHGPGARAKGATRAGVSLVHCRRLQSRPLWQAAAVPMRCASSHTRHVLCACVRTAVPVRPAPALHRQGHVLHAPGRAQAAPTRRCLSAVEGVLGKAPYSPFLFYFRSHMTLSPGGTGIISAGQHAGDTGRAALGATRRTNPTPARVVVRCAGATASCVITQLGMRSPQLGLYLPALLGLRIYP